MKPKEILEGLGFIDERFIEEANTKTYKQKTATNKILRFIIPLAASFALIITSVTIWQQGQPSLPVPPSLDDVPPIVNGNNDKITEPTEYTLFLNNTDLMMSADKIAIKGHFWNELTDEEIKQILPVLSEKHELTSTVHYSSQDNVATVFEVYADITTVKNQTVRITIAPDKIEKCYLIDGEPILSEIEGISIEAGVFVTDKNSKGNQNYIYFADFKIDGIAYYIEFVSENKKSEDDFTSLVADIILGGKADLSIFENPVIPNLIDEELSEQEAYNETDFGKYLFEIPSDYAFNGAYRWLNQNTNSLFASWSKGYNDVSISVYPNDEDSTSRIVSPEQTELYDMSLYPIPWAESMPNDTRQIIQNPVFRIEDLTLDMIKMRGYTFNEVGVPSGDSLNLRFSVLYGDIVVEIKSEDLSASYLYDKLISLYVD